MRKALEEEAARAADEEDWRWLHWLSEINRYYRLGQSPSQMAQRKWWDILTMSLTMGYAGEQAERVSIQGKMYGHGRGDILEEWNG